MSQWNIDSNIKENYLSVCKKTAIDNQFFKTFRSNHAYCQILEHVDQAKGQLYFDLIKQNQPELLNYFDKFADSETIGSPNTFQYDRWRFSPTTLRYIYVLSDLIKYFGFLNDLDIVEVGGGYGGQCKIIYDGFNPKSYTIYDDCNVIALQERFTSQFGISGVKFRSDCYETNKFDLFISNYCLDELESTTQTLYKDSVISNAKQFYITSNKPLGLGDCQIIPQNAIYDFQNHNLYLKLERRMS